MSGQINRDFELIVGMDYSASLTEFQKDITRLVTELNSNPPKIKIALDIDGTKKNLNNQINSISTNVQNSNKATSIKILDDNSKKYYDTLRTINDLLQQIRTNQDKWTAAKNGKSSKAYNDLTIYAQELEILQKQLIKGEISLDTFNDKFAKIKHGVKDAYNEIKNANEATQTWTEKFGALATKFSKWFSVSQVIMKAYRTVKQMITSVIDLDTAMTELKKVTDETEATYNKFLDDATNRAKTLGAALTDVVMATADFARLGFSINEAEKLADAAIIYKNVGDGIDDINTASESIIATLQAFGDEVSPDDIMLIIDKFNEVGNNYAISSKGVGDALLRSAAAMNAANNSLDETIALATAANTIVQDPEKVGTTLKTVSMYLRAAKTDADSAGESTDGMANSVSELRDEILSLTGNRVDIQIDESTFKSTYTILKELSEVWSDLSDISKANILEMVGGKRNANVVAALLENFSVAERAIETSANSAGSALAENEKYLSSIEGKISVFKASFETLSSSLFNSDLIKGVVDLGTALVNVLNKLQELHILLPSIISSLMIYKGLQTANNTLKINQKLSPMVASLIQEKEITEELSIAVSQLTMAEQTALVTKIQDMVVSGQITDEHGKQILTTLGLAAADGTLTIANKTLAGSFKTLMSSIPVWGWIALAISLVIDGVLMLTSAVNSSTRSLDDLETEYQSLNTTVTTAVNNYQNLKNSTEEIIPRFTELAKGVDEFGNNVKLTDEEYSEFLQLNNKIAELFPELNLGMDEQGNAMLALSYSADILTESLNDLIEAERMATNETVANTMGDVLENITDTQKAYNKEINKTKTELAQLENAYNTIKEMGDSYTWDSSNSSDRNPNKYTAQRYKRSLDILGIDYTETGVNFNPNTRTYNDTQIKANIDWEALERQYINGSTGYNSVIEKYNNKINAQWEKLRKSTVAYAQLDAGFQELDTDMQAALTKIVGSINWEETGLTKEDDIKEYLSENFLNPIYEAEPEIQNALLGLFQLKNAYGSGQIYVNEYKKTVDEILQSLKSSGLSDDTINAIKLSVDISSVEDGINTLKANITDSAEDIDKYLDSLTEQELSFAVQIIESEGSVSIDELQQKIEALRLQNAEYVNPLDFSGFLDNVDSAVEGVDKLVSAMEKLQSGTALTKSQLVELAKQYPKLLENSNLFTDGSIDGQKKMLQAILDTYEAEYDAQIDTKIAELEATQQVINDQLKLEEQKANLIGEIKNMSVNGQLDQEEELVGKIAALNDLQGQNYVSYKNGELQVNEEALNSKLDSEFEYGEKSVENIWSPYGNAIVATHNQAYNNGLKATGQYASNLLTRLKNIGANLWGGLGNLISDVMSGNFKKGTALDYFKGVTGSGSVNGGTVEVNFGGNGVTIGGQDINDWVSDQEQASIERIAALKNIEINTVNAIENLKALKGLKLTDIYASESSSKDKDDDENIFKTLYEYHKHLVAMEEETTAEFLKWLDDAYKEAYKQGEITLDEYYKYEEEVFKGMQELRDKAKDAVDELVEYRIDMLKQEIEDEKDALDKRLDNLKEFYDKQKEMLQDKYDEEKYLEEQAEKRKSVSDIQAELAMLESDDSAWAQKRKFELQEELKDAQKDLTDFENEHALESALDALDSSYEAQEKQLQAEMDALEEKLNDPNALYNQALQDIRDNSKNQLYYQMLMYNRQYGDGKDETVNSMWESTYGALDEYQKLFGENYQGITLKDETGVGSKQSSTNSQSSGVSNGSTTATGGNTNSKPSLTRGSYIEVKSGTRWYENSYGGGKSGNAKAGKIKYINEKGSHPYNIDGLGWVRKKDIVGYASGTRNARAGLAEIFEDGYEQIFTSSDGNKYKLFNAGDKVLNARATDFLYDFANSGGKVFNDILARVLLGNMPNLLNRNTDSMDIHMGDIIIQGNADNRTVSEIRRAQRENIDYILKEFTKLKN